MREFSVVCPFIDETARKYELNRPAVYPPPPFTGNSPRSLRAMILAPPSRTYAAATETPAVPTNVENAGGQGVLHAALSRSVQPWTKQAPSEVTASGVVIEGKRILTNAHVVLYSSQVQIQANQAGDKLSATVVGVAPGIDLAVLKLDDESFFKTHARSNARPSCRTSRTPVLAYGFRPAQCFVHHQGHHLAHRVCAVQLPVSGCASRLMRPSIPETAVDPPSRATR